jgi:hypothetical protein
MSTKKPMMCALRIGIDDYILPLSAGVEIVDLISCARKAERNYGLDRGRYRLTGDEVVCEVAVVRASDIVEQLALPAPSVKNRP